MLVLIVLILIISIISNIFIIRYYFNLKSSKNEEPEVEEKVEKSLCIRYNELTLKFEEEINLLFDMNQKGSPKEEIKTQKDKLHNIRDERQRIYKVAYDIFKVDDYCINLNVSSLSYLWNEIYNNNEKILLGDKEYTKEDYRVWVNDFLISKDKNIKEVFYYTVKEHRTLLATTLLKKIFEIEEN